MTDEELIANLRADGRYVADPWGFHSSIMAEKAADAIARLTLENEKLMSCVAGVQAQMRRHHARAATAERERDEARALALREAEQVVIGHRAMRYYDETVTEYLNDIAAAIRARASDKGGKE